MNARGLAVAGFGVAVGVDAGLAVAADRARPGVSVALDLLVAAAFVGAALVGSWLVGPAPVGRGLGGRGLGGSGLVGAGVVGAGAGRVRWGMAGVGAVWLVGSWFPGAGLLHQGVLLVVLLAFPGGRLRGADWLLAPAAVPVAAGVVQQIGVAAAFGAVAAWRAFRLQDPDRTYPVAAAAGIAGFLAGSWSLATFSPAAFDPQLAGLAYQALLILVALAFPVAAARAGRRRSRVADVVLGAGFSGGPDGFERVLADALGDPSLRVRMPSEPDALPGRGELPVYDGDRLLAVVEHRPGLLGDPALARGVSSAVRLAVTHAELRREEARRLADLERSRVRLLAAADRTRSRMATELLREVQVPLRRVAGHLDRAAGSPTVVRTELERVDSALSAVLAGVPPHDLGDGGLRVALRRLARHGAVPVTVSAPAGAAGDREAEAVLFYVCSEALANVAKHAGARAVRVDLARVAGELRLRVDDDGRGGADPAGSGLRGLADRLAAAGGRFRVESPPGTGTVVTAAVPAATRSSSRV